MTIKEKREQLGMSRAEMSRKYGIPIRTLENWDARKAKPPEWAEKLIIGKMEELEEMKMKNYTGRTWGSLTGTEKREMLRNANAVNAATGEENLENMAECIIDLMHPYSVAGSVKDGEIVIDDNAVIYNPVEV